MHFNHTHPHDIIVLMSGHGEIPGLKKNRLFVFFVFYKNNLTRKNYRNCVKPMCVFNNLAASILVTLKI